MERPRLEVGIYQIVDDAMLRSNRSDGTGWEWCWADWRRDWMDATPNRYAYRCLPLTIANQTGWWIKNPVGFTANWLGRSDAGSIEFRFDASSEVWKEWINSQFGEGIITWNTPFLFRTKPEGSRLLVVGPANYFKANAHPLTAMIESDWISMSFTMNYKLMAPHQPVRFELGEPLFQVIPLAGNACADLEEASVSYQKLSDDPEINQSYYEWHMGRKSFHEQKAKGEIKPDEWQKDYFHGRDVSGREAAPEHMTKVKPPKIRYSDPSIPPESGDGPNPGPLPPSYVMYQPPQNPGAAKNPAEPSVTVKTRNDALATSSTQTFLAHAAVGPKGPRGPGPVVVEAAPTRQVDDEWRRWIAENLILGATPESLLQIMTEGGFGRQETIREIELAIQSPYLKGVERLQNRLRKRDWILATYRKLERLSPASQRVERQHKLSREEFLAAHYSINRPVIITGMMDDWPAMQKWGLDYFAERFGDREVEVQSGRESATVNYEAEREKFVRKLPFREFIDNVRTAGVTNDFYLTANNTSANRQTLAELWDDIVQIPEYLDGVNQPGGFLWLGPAGTITPFHHDLTNNFMAQVIGRKRIKLSPSWDMPLMANDFHVYSKIDGRLTPSSPQPAADQPQIIDCILNPGELLFLPIGWLHFVEGIDISVTVSFTNFVFDNDFSSFYTTYHGL